ncbi:MAG: FAD-binding oxidoreductase [Actinomycetota bacterium]|nr:FAD-binding oxidoreductase [Actinomycetota bacterium]
MDLVHELVGMVGAAAVITDAEALDSRSHDVWPVARKWLQQGKHPHRPDVVVRVGDQAEVGRILAWATRAGVAVTPWALGSSVTGAPLPLRGGVVLDLSALAGVIDLNETDLTVTVRSGTRGGALEQELNDHGYTLGHSPQSLSVSSPGGWVATRATGQFSSRYGGIEDLVVGFTVVLPTGEIVRLPQAPRAAVGPDLRHLFIGAEGTLGVVTDVTLRIFPRAEHRTLEAVRFPDVRSGVEAMRRITRAGLRPHLIRLYDEDETRLAIPQPDFDGCLMFLGSEGIPALAEGEQHAALEICGDEGGAPTGPDLVESWLEHRFDFSVIENPLREPGGLAETIEVSHFWSGILGLYGDLKGALRPLAGEVLGHFSHVYPQGTSLYIIVLGTVDDDAAAEARLGQIWDVAMRTCLVRGGAISHHHGVGLARLPWVREALGDSTTVLERVKAALDPARVLNPGKLGL